MAVRASATSIEKSGEQQEFTIEDPAGELGGWMMGPVGYDRHAHLL